MKNPDLVGIIFEMVIDPAKSTTPFACINDIGCFDNKEDDVLFSMHTVFRICDIKPVPNNQRLFQVDLKLTSDDDKDLRALTDRIRKGTSLERNEWFRLGSLLIDMGQPKKAQQFLEIALKQESNDAQKAQIHHLLGIAKSDQKEYKEAIIFYENALEIFKQVFPSNNSILATSYNNIGIAYRGMGELLKALMAHEKALSIRKQSLSSNHPDLAMSYTNIGNVRFNMGEYSKALICFEENLAICQKAFSSNHPKLPISCHNIGRVYEKLRDYSKAHSFYEHAINIEKHSLSPDHPYRQICQANIDRIKAKM